MTETPTDPAAQFRELAAAGEEIAAALADSGATKQGQVVQALAQIARQLADQLESFNED